VQIAREKRPVSAEVSRDIINIDNIGHPGMAGNETCWIGRRTVLRQPEDKRRAQLFAAKLASFLRGRFVERLEIDTRRSKMRSDGLVNSLPLFSERGDCLSQWLPCVLASLTLVCAGGCRLGRSSRGANPSPRAAQMTRVQMVSDELVLDVKCQNIMQSQLPTNPRTWVCTDTLPVFDCNHPRRGTLGIQNPIRTSIDGNLAR